MRVKKLRGHTFEVFHGPKSFIPTAAFRGSYPDYYIFFLYYLFQYIFNAIGPKSKQTNYQQII